jgi:hypothetical protein
LRHRELDQELRCKGHHGKMILLIVHPYEN